MPNAFFPTLKYQFDGDEKNFSRFRRDLDALIYNEHGCAKLVEKGKSYSINPRNDEKANYKLYSIISRSLGNFGSIFDKVVKKGDGHGLYFKLISHFHVTPLLKMKSYSRQYKGMIHGMDQSPRDFAVKLNQIRIKMIDLLESMTPEEKAKKI